MPHEKYYNFPEWEMKEYEKKKAAAAAKGKGGSNLFSDEARHHEQMKSQAEQKRFNEMIVVLGGMDQAKRENMKRQKIMRAKMAMAYNRLLGGALDFSSICRPASNGFIANEIAGTFHVLFVFKRRAYNTCSPSPTVV
eukprot:CAMPEP_0171322988 /NCGR_PEP_ID=MMETSP0816-20121228/115293_1 /TAXON_ID=420281 /ORGANISM="Proboscia inermis, Strain CCAP1064/1" /LENGTH=137 /DNA_ID=CAMNT_0011821581 /DNA_START=313 /DNA_END=726 /DNA_ORIENTATION=+